MAYNKRELYGISTKGLHTKGWSRPSDHKCSLSEAVQKAEEILGGFHPTGRVKIMHRGKKVWPVERRRTQQR